jgi:hypothetical protein
VTVVPSAITAPAPRRGKGLIIAGSLLLGLSILGGVIGSALTLGRVDFTAFNRDVVIQGPRSVLVPGRIAFSVDEPLPDTEADMTVGVATTSSAFPQPACTLSTASGDAVPLSTSSFDSTLVNDVDARYTVIASARLSPGDYVAECRSPGEPSQATGAGEFTVGRTLGSEEVGAFVGPFLGFFGVLGVSGMLFVLGLILLIVGLVMRSRSGRPPTQPYGGQTAWGVPPGAQQPWPSQPWPAQPWGQPPAGAAPPGGAPPMPAPWVPPAPPAPAPSGPPPGPAGPPMGPPPAAPPTGPDSGWPTPPGQR